MLQYFSEQCYNTLHDSIEGFHADDENRFIPARHTVAVAFALMKAFWTHHHHHCCSTKVIILQNGPFSIWTGNQWHSSMNVALSKNHKPQASITTTLSKLPYFQLNWTNPISTTAIPHFKATFSTMI